MTLLAFDLPQRQVQVRTLEERDLRDLEWHGGTDLRSFYEWEWQQQQAGALTVLVAEFNGHAIGQVAIHWQGKPTHPQIPDVQSFRVMPVFQGLGIGSHMLGLCEQQVADRGFAQISLAVGVDNATARRLYERLGYHVSGEPYADLWHYNNARGERVEVEEIVVDMIKELG